MNSVVAIRQFEIQTATYDVIIFVVCGRYSLLSNQFL
jgi:hypothetical protein